MPTLDTTKSEAIVPDFADAVVIKSNHDSLDQEGVEVPKPHRNEKGYLAVSEMIHTAKSETRGSYLFQIAVPTEKGFKYDWKHLAMSMSRVLGGNGGAHYSREQKSAIIDRIAEGYKVLEKALPTVEFNDGAVAVDKLLPEVLETVAYNDVVFNAGEKDAVRLAFFEKDLKSVTDALASMKKDGDLPEEVRECLKTVGGYVDISLYAPVRSAEGLAFMGTLIDLLQQYLTPSEGAEEPVFYSAPDGMRKFADILREEASKMELTEGDAGAITGETDPMLMLPAEDLKKFLDELNKLGKLVS